MTDSDHPPRDMAMFAPVLEAARDGIVVVDEAYRYVYANPAAARMLGYPRAALIGRDLLLNFPPREHPAIRQQIAASLESPHAPAITTILRPDGEEREISYTSTRVVIAGRSCGAAILRDVTEESRRIVREREALIKIASTVAIDGSLDDVLDGLAAKVVSATGALACAVLLLEGDPPRARVAGTSGLPPDFRTGIEAAMRGGAELPSMRAAREREPIIVRDIRRFILAQPAFAPIHHIVREAAWDTLVSVPLTYRHRDVGILATYYAAGHYPDETQMTFLQAIAGQAAVAVENARLLIEVHGKAALEERQRLARDLHDSVSQALFGIALGARTARTLLQQDPQAAIEPLDYVLSLAEAGMAEMRALIFELRPESLQTEGLIAALNKEIAALRARYGITIDATLGKEPDLPLEVKEALYRISQEALHNTVKHARATHVDLRLEQAPDRVALDIRDNGIGFDPAGHFPGHLGLRSMRERVSRLGGTLTLESAPEQGAHIRAEIPIDAMPNPPAG
jgi:PAS domain S-box-containing protein